MSFFRVRVRNVAHRCSTIFREGVLPFSRPDPRNVGKRSEKIKIKHPGRLSIVSEHFCARFQGLTRQNGVNSCPYVCALRNAHVREILNTRLWCSPDVFLLRLSSHRPFGINSWSYVTKFSTNVPQATSEQVKFEHHFMVFCTGFLGSFPWDRRKPRESG